MNVGFVSNETYGLLKNARAALVTSGTATLETALFKVPQVVCYSTNWLTYIIARRLINIKYISLVNIILNKWVVPELIQTSLNKQNLNMELNIVFNKKEDIILDYNKIIDSLDKEGASRNAAKFIVSAI
jgi:lipid-A-disaccharide synthase